MGFSNWPWNASNAIGRDMNLLYYKNVFCKLFNMIIISGQRRQKLIFVQSWNIFHMADVSTCTRMWRTSSQAHQGLSTSLLLKMPRSWGGDELSHQFARKQKSFKKPIKKLTLVLNCFLLQLLRIRVSEERQFLSQQWHCSTIPTTIGGLIFLLWEGVNNCPKSPKSNGII